MNRHYTSVPDTMRVITGRAKGRRLKTVRGTVVRPTSDRVKAALFSVLGSRFDLVDRMVLDLFAGTGAVGIEALSRGAKRVVFVEHGRRALAALQANVKTCGFAEQAEILPFTVERALRHLRLHGPQFDGVLVDPPYGSGQSAGTLEQLGQTGILQDEAWVMVERLITDVLADTYGTLRLTETRRYGKTGLALYTVRSASERVKS